MQKNGGPESAPKRYSAAVRAVVRYAWIAALFLVFLALAYSFILGPSDADDSVVREVIVSPDDTLEEVGATLAVERLAKHWFTLSLAAWLTGSGGEVRPGGYQIAPSMDAWTLIHAFREAPYLSWIDVPQGLRKEEVADVFADAFEWDARDIEAFLTERSVSPDLSEGVYYSGTYLMPSDISPQEVAGRLRTKFEDTFAPLAEEAAKQKRPWAEVITFASIIERESGRLDKKLVAGILQNRLDKGMKLQVDATLQYITGNDEEGWWHVPHSDDKYVESPFNTYIYAGLPPAPIASPAFSSIEAALNPQKTSCLYYLHDARGLIHCSDTYSQHLRNIDYYLR